MSIAEPHMRVWTRFPHIPTGQPNCVENLTEQQKQQWIDFSKSVIDILHKRNTIGVVQIVVVIVLVIVIIILIGLIAYFIWKYANRK